jgi:hypothetical protein
MFIGNVNEALNNHDMRHMAKKRLPKWLFGFVDRGTEDEVALRNNRAGFERIKLKTQVLVDVSKRNQEITLFGKRHAMPLGIAPTGPAGMLWYKGELELARAAKAANIPFTLATGSQTSMEDVAQLVGGRRSGCRARDQLLSRGNQPHARVSRLPQYLGVEPRVSRVCPHTPHSPHDVTDNRGSFNT